MRQAMANAEVGDDVFGDDPTVRRLEERVAELLGKEAALFVPSGTMANQIALRAQTERGDEVICGVGAHCWRSESGALAALAGVQTQVVGTDGTFTAADVRAALHPYDPYGSPTKIVAVENTQNEAGGKVWDPTQLAEVVSVTHELGLLAHLDGARLWNAAAATGKSEKELAAGFDSVSVCLSKGLGAPVGSCVAGSKALVKAAHRLRKMYGGGMRQAGILAAAGLHALEHHRARLHEDHANARALAEALGSSPHLRVRQPDSNIVMFDLARGTTAHMLERAKGNGVLLGSWRVDARAHPQAATLQRIRAVCHLDVNREQVSQAAASIIEVAASL
jgi:threonine aldolase